jgi:hypothetical protein
MSEVKIGLIKTKEDYQWFESAKRGGMSMARNSIGVANHPGIGAYDASKPLTWIHYDDANNLYGWAMCCKLPVSSPEECNLDTFDLHEVSKWGRAPAYFNEPCETWQGDFGGMMEFDFDYPDQLHDTHSDFPLAPELMAVPDGWLHDVQRDPKRKADAKKLVATLNTHLNYKATISMALLMERMGLVITKVHRVMEYKQTAHMREYIMKNTLLRAEAKKRDDKV